MKNLLTILIIALLLSGCGNNSVSPPVPPPDDFNLVDPQIVTPADAYGTLHHAIRNFQVGLPGITDSLTTAVYGKAIAGFIANPGDSTYTDAGCSVQLGPYTLTRESNGRYSYFQNSDDSLIFRNTIQWNIACRAIDKNIAPADFPTRTKILSEKVIYRLGGYTARNTSITGADSVIYQLQTSTSSRTRVIQKTLPGNATQCTFSMDELLKLDASDYGLITITGYKLEEDTYSGKKYYSTIQQSQSQLVTIY